MTPATPGEIAQLLGYMPIIVRASGISDWEREFCVSICGRIKRGAFIPSEKQIGVMRRVVEKFQASTRETDDVDLVERGD